MIADFYEWLSEQPNPENVSITDVLLYHILLELRAQRPTPKRKNFAY